jgi:hypothetical protein
MRSAIFLITFVFITPATAPAAPIVDHYYTTGILDFGFTNAHQRGWGPYRLSTNTRDFTDDFDIALTAYEMTSGPFIRQELTRSAAGDVIQSTYFYEPGTLVIDFRLQSLATREVTHGSFTAPIDMTIVVDETGDTANLRSLFTLGSGVFDGSIANLLGVGRRTSGGTVEDSFIDITEDHTSSSRRAYDAAFFLIDAHVPEPGGMLLGLVGAAAISLQRWKNRVR